MPMGHCGRNRNTITVHDIENVVFFFFLIFFFSWEGGEHFCAQKSIAQTFRVQLLKKFNSIRPEEIGVVDQHLNPPPQTRQKMMMKDLSK